MEKGKCIAIVLAAGQGRRMGTKVQKQYLHIQDRPVVYYALESFQKSSIIDEIILVTGEKEIVFCKEEIVQRYQLDKVRKVISGGNERFDSVYRGLLCCEDCAYVFIHDGARPFVDEAVIERTYAAVQEYDACVAAMPSKDTVKIADGDGFVKCTPDRSTVWTIQTPQVFSYTLIRRAYDDLMANPIEGITDDAMVVEQTEHHPVKLVEGSYYNIKITTPDDLKLAELFVNESL
ncbi:2-C-methyl-D-erythritol 4-phosphate cytidylyltransferase [Ruminococcus sp. OA3]|uniref:2-C-methyl-D-erythritol 4-phosphate cytidylyltransferase n=1 Tax=Ruminococcus sp. OA3 TaxID=2914164 RepID=UPI001F069C78|nr:2-C-methyl-D-erythritol 4-phosphate cytidylyltransferase [Ruminococcus sp. OA3]MCH1981971.1 2-C-methyl-D-erythritol 4-phosphate cytidylyltransferase [Ruminococcus sp. OA3]